MVKVNNRKVLDGVLERIGLGGEANASKRLVVLRAIDKLDRLGIDAVRTLLGEGRKDESGDFTQGAGLDEKQIEAVLQTLNFKVEFQKSADDIERESTKPAKCPVRSFCKEGGEKLWGEARSELIGIAKLAKAAGYDDDRICIDASVVRGLEYYTGPVYEVELTFEIDDDKGRPIRFGSVGGGGRYDGLVSRFMGQPVPATGFSIGVSRLQAALAALGKLGERAAPGPVLVAVFGADSVAACQTFVSALRNAGIRAELYLGNPKHGIGQQLKYADRRGSPCAVIQGPDEKAKGEVQIRDLIAGAALGGEAKERDEYLKQQAQAQVSVKETDLVEAVRKLLARHKLG